MFLLLVTNKQSTLLTGSCVTPHTPSLYSVWVALIRPLAVLCRTQRRRTAFVSTAAQLLHPDPSVSQHYCPAPLLMESTEYYRVKHRPLWQWQALETFWLWHFWVHIPIWKWKVAKRWMDEALAAHSHPAAAHRHHGNRNWARQVKCKKCILIQRMTYTVP